MKSNIALLKHIYAKPFMKYESKVLSGQKEQFFILYGELEIFKKKVNILNNFFARDPPDYQCKSFHKALTLIIMFNYRF